MRLRFSSSSECGTFLLCRRLAQACPFFVFASPVTMDLSGQPATGAAQRRKQRRLRSWWRHEQQSIAAALATYKLALRGQTTARAGEGGSRDALQVCSTSPWTTMSHLPPAPGQTAVCRFLTAGAGAAAHRGADG